MSLLGGKFKITDGETFISLLAKHKEENPFPLAFRGPRDAATPFYMDIDIVQTSNKEIPTKVFTEMVHHFLVHARKATGVLCGLNVVISCRAGAYWEGTKCAWKNGFHVVVPNLNVTPEIMKTVRDSLLQDATWFKLLVPYNVKNTPENIIDIAITTRRNGLIVISLCKPLKPNNGPCSPHHICFTGLWSDGGWKEKLFRDKK